MVGVLTGYDARATAGGRPFSGYKKLSVFQFPGFQVARVKNASSPRLVMFLWAYGLSGLHEWLEDRAVDTSSILVVWRLTYHVYDSSYPEIFGPIMDFSLVSAPGGFMSNQNLRYLTRGCFSLVSLLVGRVFWTRST